jgi:transposase
MRAYSADLRTRVFADVDGGLTCTKAAVKYSVSASWVRRLVQRRRETGETTPRIGRFGRKPKLAGQTERIRAAIAERPDLTLQELREHLGLEASLATMWRAVAAAGLTLKKNAPRGRTRSTRREPGAGELAH